MAKKRKKPGPKEDKLKINGDWEKAIGKAIRKEKPADGWPDKDKKKSK